MKIICNLFGHSVSEDALYPICDRCGDEHMGPKPFMWYWGIRAPYHWLKFQIREQIDRFRHKHMSFKNWLTCEECGKHFGQHDNNVDHVPF